jgi:hypothetical protein
MIPHERSLVAHLKDQPFVLIGINSDADKAEFRRKAQEMGVTWRSSWQGGLDGPIPTKWGVEGWPTLYLLDAKGVIRQVWLGSPGNEVLDEEIDKLLAEMKKS